MSTHRFYVTPLTIAGELPDDQSHHARDVLRLHADDNIILFDGHGQWATAQLNIQKRHASYNLTGPIHLDPPPLYPITIASAVPKADRSHFLLEQISQLGIARLIWLDCRYSVVHPGAEAGKMAKWRRLAIESAKQCGRSRLLVVAPPLTPEQLLATPEFNHTILWAHTTADETLRQRLTAWLAQNAAIERSGQIHGITILIGPEGGWSQRESELLTAVSQPVQIGNHILRVETAATACAAIAQSLMPAKRGSQTLP